MDQPKIFFSYSRIDASDFTLRLYNDLKNAGADVWIDQVDIKAGARWDIEIGKALKACQCVLFIASDQSVESDNVLDEVYYALDKKKLVVPVLFSLCDIPYRINRLHHIDFTNDYDKAIDNLLNTLNFSKTIQQNIQIKEESKQADRLNERMEKNNVNNMQLTELQEANEFFEKDDHEKAANIYLKYLDALEGYQLNRIGWMYQTGTGVEQNYKEAIRLYRKGAEKGYNNSIYNIGILYYEGSGIEKDYTEAMKWFRKAAEQGVPDAMVFIGIIYIEGNGVSKDYNEAMKWFRKAAKQGNVYAMYHIGILYEHGKGVKEDINEAISWYQKASENGNKDAKDKLRTLGIVS